MNLEVLRAVDAGFAHCAFVADLDEDQRLAAEEIVALRLLEKLPARGRFSARYVVTVRGSDALGTWNFWDDNLRKAA